jgi:hypothetical protein
MALHTTDEGVLHRIEKLVEEERAMRAGGTAGERLRDLEVELDQCWDLLRQRRAKREFGEDPDQAEVRPADVVESYEQ